MNWYLRYINSARANPDFEVIEKKGPKKDQSGLNFFDENWKMGDDFIKNYGKEWIKREEFVKDYSWSVPTEEAIKKLKTFIGGKKVLEVGSGLGLWAKLLQLSGVHMTPTDSFESHGTGKAKRDPYRQFTDVENIKGTKAVKKYSDHSVLFLSWPPYDKPLAASALKRFTGDKVIYIGEGSGGATGNDEFHKILDRDFTEVDSINIPRWTGINDRITLWERKSQDAIQ